MCWLGSQQKKDDEKGKVRGSKENPPAGKLGPTIEKGVDEFFHDKEKKRGRNTRPRGLRDVNVCKAKPLADKRNEQRKDKDSSPEVKRGCGRCLGHRSWGASIGHSKVETKKAVRATRSARHDVVLGTTMLPETKKREMMDQAKRNN